MAAAQRLALQLPPRRGAKSVKMRTISRAEGGQLQVPVGPRLRLERYCAAQAAGMASCSHHSQNCCRLVRTSAISQSQIPATSPYRLSSAMIGYRLPPAYATAAQWAASATYFCSESKVGEIRASFMSL